jgi:hypothetical protein
MLNLLFYGKKMWPQNILRSRQRYLVFDFLPQILVTNFLKYIGLVNNAKMRASVSTLQHQTWEIQCSDQTQFARSVSLVIQFANAYTKKNVETVQKS